MGRNRASRNDQYLRWLLESFPLFRLVVCGPKWLRPEPEDMAQTDGYLAVAESKVERLPGGHLARRGLTLPVSAKPAE